MTARTTYWLMRPSLLRTFVSLVRLAVRLLREPQVGWFAKAVPLLAVMYVLSPLDLVPDVIPIVGEIDDLGMVFLALQGFLKLSPGEAVTFHRTAIEQGHRYSPMSDTDRVIDAEWRHEG